MTDDSLTNRPDRSARLVAYLRARRGAFIVYLKGCAMGAAGTVPGVSGGTIALIVGIYDRFIIALSKLDETLLLLALRVYRADGRSRFQEALEARDTVFLFLLFAGILTAIFTLARVLNTVLVSYPGPTFAFFGGLIAASAVVLYDRRWLTRPQHVVAGLAGFSIAFLITGATATDVFPETLWMVFIAAAIAISGMVLPGLSGSFILLILGQYEYLTGVVTSFGDNVVTVHSGGNLPALVSDSIVLGTVVMGAVVGFLTTATVVRAALKRFPGTTFAFLVSLMVGALRLPVVEVANATEFAPQPVAVVAISALCGSILIFVLEHSTDSVGYDAYA